MNATSHARILNFVSPLALLLAWELAVRAGILDGRFFTPPTIIASRFWQMTVSGELERHIGISLTRVLIGLVLGATSGAVIGITMGMSKIVRAVIQPLVAATYPIPRTSMVPLFLLIFGLGELSKYMIVAVSVFYVVLINAMTGVMSIDRIYLDVGKDAGASRWQSFWTIALPGAIPMIMSGLQIGVGVAFIVLVVAEYTGSETGVGYLIWSGWETLNLDQMYVGLLTMAGLGWLSGMLMNEIEWYLVPWRRNR